MAEKVSPATLERFRHMSMAQRNAAVARTLLGAPAADVERDVLAYRAAFVTALREQRLWPKNGGPLP